MAGVNKVILVGIVANDPIVTQTKYSVLICEICGGKGPKKSSRYKALKAWQVRA